VAYFFKYCSGVEAEGMVVDSISRRERDRKRNRNCMKILESLSNKINTLHLCCPWISSVLIHGEFFKAQGYTRGVRAC